MSEPRAAASSVEALLPSLLHWTVHDDRIDWRSDAYAVVRRGRAVLVDPLPLAPRALASLPRVSAIVLTIQSHQRSAWRFRRRFGVEVYAPRGAEGLEDQPDHWYDERSELPGGFRAIHAPGPCEASYALLVRGVRGTTPTAGDRGGILFLGDLLTRGDDGPLQFVPGEYQDNPRRTRAGVRALVRIGPRVLCPGHGAPILDGGARALREALRPRSA